MSAPRHAPRVPFALLIGGLIVGGMALLLLLNTVSAANEVKRHDIAQQDESVAAQVQELQNEVADSAAPQNLAAAAAALGMVPALNPAFLVVAGNGTVRVLGSPAPVTPAYVAPPPAPRTSTAATSTTTSTATATATATSTSTATSPSTSTTTGRSKDPKDSTGAVQSSPSASPTPTPTPTVTLPGGNR
jgi:hypothetical protein